MTSRGEDPALRRFRKAVGTESGVSEFNALAASVVVDPLAASHRYHGLCSGSL